MRPPSYTVPLTFTLCLMLAACGGDDDNPPTPSPTPTPTLTPTPANQVPVAVDDTAQVESNQVIAIAVLSNDEYEGIALIESIDQGENGQAVIDDEQIAFTPTNDFVGEAIFQYRISDDSGLSNWATVTVTVLQTTQNNQLPNAQDDEQATEVNSAVLIDVLANDSDADGDTLVLAGVSNGTYGTAEIQDGLILYTPQADFVGQDSFEYSIEDTRDGTATATVTVNVEGNGLPVAVNDFFNTSIDESVEVNVVANDRDGRGSGLQVVELEAIGSNGSFEILEDGRSIRFTPNSGFSGLAVVNYTVQDGADEQSIAELSVRVHAAADIVRELDVVVAIDGSLGEDLVGHIDNLALDDEATVENIIARTIGAVDAPNELMFHIKNAGEVDASPQDFLFSLSTTAEKYTVVPLTDLMDDQTALSEKGDFYHINDDTLQEFQPQLSIDLDNDGAQDTVLLREFGLVFHFTETPVSSPVDLNIAATYISAANSDTPFVINATALDINSDDVEDLVVAVDTLAGTSGPRIKVFYGPLSQHEENIFDLVLNDTTGFEIDGFDSESTVTEPLQLLVGDLNGDNKADLIIGGLSEQDSSGTATGQVYILWGGQTDYGNFNIEDFIVENSAGTASRLTPNGSVIRWAGADEESIGGSLAIEDINGDAINDLVLGNSLRGSVANGRYLQAVSTIYGQLEWAADQDLSIAANNNLLGERIVANKLSATNDIIEEVIFGFNTADVNGDGYGDVVVQTSGKASIVLGGSAIKPQPIDAGGVVSNWPVIKLDLIDLQPPMASIDINIDGFEDIVITRKNNSVLDAFIIYGGLQFNIN